MYKYNKMVIGIDQSYTRTGITLAADGIPLKISSVNFKATDDHCVKRKKVTNVLNQIIAANKHKTKQLIVIVERIRQFSGGVLSMAYIQSTGALIGAIVDAAYAQNIKVYSVDTRAWKAQVVGTVKPKANKYNVDPKKWPTLDFVLNKYPQHKQSLLVPVSARCKKYALQIGTQKYCYNDDAADSCGIALYGFTKNRNLKLER